MAHGRGSAHVADASKQKALLAKCKKSGNNFRCLRCCCRGIDVLVYVHVTR